MLAMAARRSTEAASSGPAQLGASGIAAHSACAPRTCWRLHLRAFFYVFGVSGEACVLTVSRNGARATE